MPRVSMLAPLALLCLSGSAPGADLQPEGGSAPMEPFIYETREGQRVEAELGRIEVPENRDQADTRSIKLFYARLPARTATPLAPVVYLAGGPGSSGIGALSYRHRLFGPLRDVADVIALDQRGTGRSNDLDPDECETLRPRPANRVLDHDTLIALELDAARECAQLWRNAGIDLAAYHTLASVADLEALRQALGAERLNLLGISYGTHLALAYLRTHPDRVDRLVLAGVEGPDHTVKMPDFSDRQFQSLVELINAQPEARRRFPDFAQRVERLLRNLEAAPVTLEFLPADGSPPMRVVVGRPDLERTLISYLRDPGTLREVPPLIEAIEAGDYSGLNVSSQIRFEFEAMGEAMDAQSGVSNARLTEIRAAQEMSLFGGGTLLVNAGMSEALDLVPLPDAFRQPVVSDRPALLISGTLDGRTPPSNASEVARGLRNSQHLVIDNAGHSNDLFFSSPDIVPAIVAFLKGGQAPSRLETRPPDLASAHRRVAIPPELARRYLGRYHRGDGIEWRVISLGTTRTLDANGQTLAQSTTLQYRVDDDGFTLTPLAEDRFFVNLPGWTDRVYRFVQQGDAPASRLEVIDPGRPAVVLERTGDLP